MHFVHRYLQNILPDQLQNASTGPDILHKTNYIVYVVLFVADL